MTKTHSIGVIVGRFQVPSLTEGHKEILEHCLAQGHETNILFLGVPHKDVRCTKNNPLPYQARKCMIEEVYGDKFVFRYVRDEDNDIKWSRALDDAIDTFRTDKDTEVVIYGTREGLLAHYKGQYKVEEYRQRLIVPDKSSTLMTDENKNIRLGFRKGVVYATQNSWTNYFPTVDCAIAMDESFEKFLFAKKPNEKLLRFVGGFWDAKDDTVEDAAIREAKEETNLDCRVHSYICTAKIDDPRYRAEKEKIMTTMYLLVADKNSPAPKAMDDIAEVHIRNIAELTEADIVDAHRLLFQKLVNHIKH